MIALIRLTPSQFQKGWRRGRIAQWLGMALAWLLLGGAVFLLVRDPLAVNGSSSVDLRDSILSTAFIVGLMLFVPLVLFICLMMYLPTKDRWIGSRTLRAAILAGESKQIPAALDQPPPLAADELPLDTKPFRPLKWRAGTSSFFPMLLGAMFIALTVWAAFSILDPTHTSGPRFPRHATACDNRAYPGKTPHFYWRATAHNRRLGRAAADRGERGCLPSTTGAFAGGREAGARANGHSPGTISPPFVCIA